MSGEKKYKSVSCVNFLVRPEVSGLVINCHMEPAYWQTGPQMIIGAEYVAVCGDFITLNFEYNVNRRGGSLPN